MSASDATATIGTLLACAASASDDGEHDEYVGTIRDAARLLLGLYEHNPLALPVVLEALAGQSTVVRPADLAAACEWAADAAAKVTDELPAVLHPECSTWVALACSLHPGADPLRVTAAATLIMSIEGIRRPGDLPMTEELSNLAGACTYADLLAGIEVRHLHADALADRAGQLDELMGLVEVRMADGATLVEAVDQLHGPDRDRAEVLFASLPAVVNVSGGGR